MSKKALGAVLLHGFTGMPIGLGNLAHHVERLGLPYRAPTLRGHGMASPNALADVKWTDWVEDAVQAMEEVLEETEKVTLIGHSMGGMIGIILAAENQWPIDSIIVAGTSTRVKTPFAPGDPLHFLAPLMLRLRKKGNMYPKYTDPECIRLDTGYTWLPTIAVLQLYDIVKETRKRLPELTVPTLILHSKKDSICCPEAAQLMYDTISTPADQKQLIWFEKTEHVMFLDCEAEAVNQAVVEYLQGRLKQNQ